VHPGDHGDEVPAVSDIPLGQAHTEICAVSRENAPGGDIRDAGGVLPAQGGLHGVQLGASGAYCRGRDGGTSPLAAENAAFHRRRYGGLYAAGAVCLLQVTQ